MTDLTIRDAAVSDLPFIIDLLEADSVVGSTEDRDTDAPYRAAFEAISRDPNQHLLVAELGGKPVGTFQLTFSPGLVRKGQWRCTVESVHVLPDHRGRRIGEKMMDWAVEKAREKGCGVVQLTSNKARADAHRFYVRLGFDPSHQGFKLYL